MNILFFGVGFILFSIYLIFLIWNIIYNGNKQQKENYPTLDDKQDKEYYNGGVFYNHSNKNNIN